MFHGECWKHIFLGSEGQRWRSRVTKTLPAWVFALLWVLASSGYFQLLLTSVNCIRVVYRLATNWIIGHIQGTTYYMGVEIPTGRDNFGGCSAHWTALGVENPMTSSQLTTTQPPYLNNLISTQRPRSTRSSSVVTLARPPSSSSLKITDRSFLLFSLCYKTSENQTNLN